MLNAFFFGVYTGRYKHFPYNILYYIYNGEPNFPPFIVHGRNFNINYYIKKDVNSRKETGVYLTYGQSNSANYGEYGYNVKNDVFQFLLGETFVYQDPSLGADGTGGSVWGMVGDKLINKRFHEQVVFSNCGWGAAEIEQLRTGHSFQFLVQNYKGLLKKFGKIDGILFHQGEANNYPEGIENYYDNFLNFTINLKENGIEVPIYLSRASLCGEKNPINDTLTNIQNKLIKNYSLIKEGPNTDLLYDKKYRRSDYCHFSSTGYEKFSDMWVEALIK